MRPVTSQSLCPIIVRGRAGGYRTLMAIWAMLTGLAVIGLAGAMVIGPTKVSKISENIIGPDSHKEISKISETGQLSDNYQGGLLDMMRMARRSSKAKDGIQDGGQATPGLVGALERSKEILYTDCQ